jgi:hypothetical protein
VVQRIRQDLPVQAWALTGGFAGEALTKHYRGDTLGVFIDGWEPETMKRWRWLPDERGPITVFRPFSAGMLMERSFVDENPMAHPLLVYAELAYDGRERAHETAERIREQYLQYLTNDATP